MRRYRFGSGAGQGINSGAALTMQTKTIQKQLRKFAKDRDWDQFHNPKNLATALVCEAAELAEIFQWMTPKQAVKCMDDLETSQALRHEIADVQIYVLRLADKLGVDLDKAVQEKLRINAEKYPVSLAKGNAVKYSRRKG